MSDNFKIETRTIEGSIYQRNKPNVPQEGPEEFLAAIDALLGVDGVESIVWDQYTPYFNDGDPCEFTIYDVQVKLSEKFGFGEYDGDYGNGLATTYDLYQRGKVTQESGSFGSPQHKLYYSDENMAFELNGEDTTDIYRAIEALGGLARFENVVSANFGDHARVTATKAGFDVEYYDHE